MVSFLEPSPVDPGTGHRPIEAVIFEGGGTKGMVYAGCIARLEEHGMFRNVNYFAGSSAGAQTAALFAAGYTGQELREIMSNAPWKKLLDGNEGCCGCFAGLRRLFKEKGFYKGDFLQRYLDDLLERKLGRREITFQQFHAQTGRVLRLGVCNLATRSFGFLDHLSAPNVAISEGCRASSSIPFVFVPKILNMPTGEEHYVDGGVQGNLPATAFGLKHGIAFHLMPGPQYSEAVDNRPRPAPEPPRTFLAFTETVVDMLLNHVNPESADAIQAAHHIDPTAVQNEQGCYVIKINTQHHTVLETSLTEEQKVDMIQLGTDAADGFLEHELRPTHP